MIKRTVLVSFDMIVEGIDKKWFDKYMADLHTHIWKYGTASLYGGNGSYRNNPKRRKKDVQLTIVGLPQSKI